VLIACAVTFSACSSDDEETSGADRRETVACQVTHGGVRRDGLNALARSGLMRAKRELQVTTTMQAGLQVDIQNLGGQRCDIIISVGYGLAESTLAAAESRPDDRFAIVDFWFDFQSADDLARENVRMLVFRSDEASFLAGYLAAGMTKTGKIGTFGGANLPTVKTVMDGFLAGARAYKQDNHTNLTVLGWNGARGIFTGDSRSAERSRLVTERMIAKGADIILPVVGAGVLGAAEAAQNAGNVLLIGTDADQALFTEEYADLWLTSIQKDADSAVFNAIASTANGSFSGGLYAGTLENEGVSLAPYHRLSGQIPSPLKKKIAELRQGIIDGWVSVDPNDYVPYDVHPKDTHH
jgi:basic membrane protein A and related proteins